MMMKLFKFFRRSPRITVIMTVNDASRFFLEAAINSVRTQDYKNWELLIIDNGLTAESISGYLRSLTDKNIKVRFLSIKQDSCAALNDAVPMAQGGYVAFMKSSDILAVEALSLIAGTIREKGADMVYSDEDVVAPMGKFVRPYFKPEYSPEALLSCNYMGYIVAIKKSIILAIGGFRKELEAAKYHDLWLRCVEKTGKVCHIPKVLYHRRGLPCNAERDVISDQRKVADGVKAVTEACERRGISAAVSEGAYFGTYRIRRNIIGNPKVNIIIPFRDKPKYLKSCIDSILAKTSYKNFDILAVDNNSIEEETAALVREYELSGNKIAFIKYDGKFNYSKMNNYAVGLCAGEHIVLLNNDVEIITGDWLEELLAHSQRPEVGAVGAKLYYPDGKIQHAGVIIGMDGVAGHAHKNIDKHGSGYFHKGAITQNISAVTGACMMIKRKLYIDIGGLDDRYLPVAYSDTDLCLRLAEKGYKNIFTPYCELVHHESVSRGKIMMNHELKTLMQQIEYFKRRHKKILNEGDPYYSPNLPLNVENLDFLNRASNSMRSVEVNLAF